MDFNKVENSNVKSTGYVFGFDGGKKKQNKCIRRVNGFETLKSDFDFFLTNCPFYNLAIIFGADKKERTRHKQNVLHFHYEKSR